MAINRSQLLMLCNENTTVNNVNVTVTVNVANVYVNINVFLSFSYLFCFSRLFVPQAGAVHGPILILHEIWTRRKAHGLTRHGL